MRSSNLNSTLLVVLLLAVVVAVAGVRYHSERYGLSFEYDEARWTLEDHPNTPEERSNAFTLRSQTSDRQIVLGTHLYHKAAHHDVRAFDELFRKANPSGVTFKLEFQEAFNVNGLEAYFVAGNAPRTDFCNVHIAHGKIVWYVWTNIGYQPENASSLYEDYFALVMSLQFDENAPSELVHDKMYGDSYTAIYFDEDHPALSINGGYKVAFSDVPDNNNKKKHRMARDCYSQCTISGGWNFGTQGTSSWCWCCNNNCGGFQAQCSQQGWPGNCGGSNGGGGTGSGSFAGWNSPLPGAWIWCGSPYHYGTAQWAADAQGPAGNPVYALVGATVSFAGWDNYGYGNLVMLNNGDYYMAHAHLTSIYTSSGGVSQGQTVGTIGGTGGNYYPHLHFHIRTGGGVAVNLNQLPKFTDPNGGWPSAGTSYGGANCAKFA